MPQPHQIYIGSLSRRERSWNRQRRRTARLQALAGAVCAMAAGVAVVAGALGYLWP
jgi:ABC-type transport system involved in cytochrome bd biosynthesis fused ATPase/permease subunit